MTPTPDTLRALAISDADTMNPWGNNDTCQRPRCRALREGALSHAEAWEADRKRIAKLEGKIDDMEDMAQDDWYKEKP